LVLGQTQLGTGGSLVNDSTGTISTSGAFSASIEVPFSDSGTVSSTSGGSLDLGATTSVANGATFAGSGITVPWGATISPLGSSAVDLSNVTLSDTSVNGPGTFTVPAGGTLNIVNQGETDTTTLANGIRLVNDGTLNVDTNVLNIDDTSVLENAGSLVLGQTQLGTGGSLVNDSTGTISTSGAFSASIEVPFSDSGSIDIAQGTLDIPAFTPSSTSTLTIGVSTSPGQLSVSGAATLTGTLAIATKSGYLPAIGKKITILTAGSVSGTFSSVTGTQLTGEHWVVSYKAKSAVLTATNG
jgi:hypothetical protein